MEEVLNELTTEQRLDILSCLESYGVPTARVTCRRILKNAGIIILMDETVEKLIVLIQKWYDSV